MTDKELLEMAAKAAGIKLDYRRSSNAFYYDDPETGREQWQPIESDRQAFRLAVGLYLMVDIRKEFVEVLVTGHKRDGFQPIKEWIRSAAPYAATRRAIVRAAAEIGREL